MGCPRGAPGQTGGARRGGDRCPQTPCPVVGAIGARSRDLLYSHTPFSLPSAQFGSPAIVMGHGGTPRAGTIHAVAGTFRNAPEARLATETTRPIVDGAGVLTANESGWNPLRSADPCRRRPNGPTLTRRVGRVERWDIARTSKCRDSWARCCRRLTTRGNHGSSRPRTSGSRANRRGGAGAESPSPWR